MMPPCPTRVLPQAAAPIFDLTVITVCRNVLGELKRTVASVLKQKEAFKGLSIEHVVVDGASTDGTPEWLAEMKAQGRIEAYVSEPDGGIYDAMNKGINMARGAVLFFLNAGDLFADGADIEACIRPILDGRTSTVAAAAIRGGGDVHIPCIEKLFINTFCNHQGYFASSDLYRRLGGYDTESFRCCADADFMNKAALAAGEMHLRKEIVAQMAPGGVSEGCSVRYLDEYMELMCRYKAAILQRAAQEPNYRELIVSHIFSTCIRLRFWQEQHGKELRPQLLSFASLCEEFALLAPAPALRRAMLFIARTYTPHLLRHRRASRLMWLRLRRHMKVITCAANNPYRELIQIPDISLGKTLTAYVQRLRKAFFH